MVNASTFDVRASVSASVGRARQLVNITEAVVSHIEALSTGQPCSAFPLSELADVTGQIEGLDARTGEFLLRAGDATARGDDDNAIRYLARVIRLVQGLTYSALSEVVLQSDPGGDGEVPESGSLEDRRALNRDLTSLHVAA